MIPIRCGRATSVALLLAVSLVAAGCSGNGGGNGGGAANDAGAAADTVRYKFKEGEKLRYDCETTTTRETTFAGEQPTKIVTTYAVEVVWDIMKLDKDGRAYVTLTLERVQITIDGSKGKTKYDSKEDKRPYDREFQTIFTAAKAVVGGQATCTVDPRGEVTDFKLLDKLAKVIDGPPRPNLVSVNLARELGVQLLTLPKEGMRKGTSWSEKGELPDSGGPLSVEHTYACDGTTERGGRNLQKVTITVTGAYDPTRVSDINKISFKGGTGVAYIDQTTGRLLEMSKAQSEENEITLEKKIQWKTETVYSVKLLENAEEKR
jgi:hypothetical protein